MIWKEKLYRMNLPNKLTLLRIFMIPFFVIILLYRNGTVTAFRHLSMLIFILAALTDTLDGYIARKNNLITNFGKFMDPLADKLLVCSALICFIQLGDINAVIVIIIIAREFIISGFRLVAGDAGIVIAASKWGKFKTISQMIAVILILLNIESLYYITQFFIYLMLILTIFSLFDYILKNHQVITKGNI